MKSKGEERREQRRLHVEDADTRETAVLRRTLPNRPKSSCASSNATAALVRCLVAQALYPETVYDEIAMSNMAATHIDSVETESMRTKPPKQEGRGSLTWEYTAESHSLAEYGGLPRVYPLGDWGEVCKRTDQVGGYRYSLEEWMRMTMLEHSYWSVQHVSAADFVYMPFCMTNLLFMKTAVLELHSDEDMSYLEYQGALLDKAIENVEDGYIMSEISRFAAMPAFLECWNRESCKFMVVTIHGRHVWQKLSNYFGKKAVFVTHAGMSTWTSHGSVYWTDLKKATFAKHSPLISRVKKPAGCRAACAVHCQSLPPAVLQRDIVLPWTVAYGFVERAGDFNHRDLLAFFVGTLNSCSRLLLNKVYRGRTLAALQGSGDNFQNTTLVFPPIVKLGQEHWSELAFRSILCLVPDGDSPNTGRLIEVVMHGCIPVIISNRLQPPMHEYINWHRIAYFVREDEIPFLPRILAGIANDKEDISQRQERLKEVAPALDFTRGLPTMMTMALRRRALEMRTKWAKRNNASLSEIYTR